jgi:hypothetical protein
MRVVEMVPLRWDNARMKNLCLVLSIMSACGPALSAQTRIETYSDPAPENWTI